MKLLTVLLISFFNLTQGFAQSDFVTLTDKASLEHVKFINSIPIQELKAAELSESDWSLLKKLEDEAIEKYNNNIAESFKKSGRKAKEAKGYKINSLDQYKIQYVPYLNERDEKEIWINGFCSDSIDWKKETVTVLDGGNCYFKIRINLSTQRCLQIGTNGYA